MTQHTPYDADCGFNGQPVKGDHFGTLRLEARQRREGYLRAKAEDAALLAAEEAMLDVRFTGGYCLWCGIAVRIELLTDISGHYMHCALLKAQAAIKLAKEGAA